MQVFRIAKRERIRDLSGKGAEISGGRWNRKGVPCLYASSSLALCICEILVHTEPGLPPSDLWYAEFHLAESLVSSRFAGAELSADTASAGTSWLASGESCAIRVPSSVLPREYRHDYNVIFNPRHPAFGQVELVAARPCPFDRRFFVVQGAPQS